MTTTTANDREVKLQRRRFLSELKTLTAAVKDENALMAGNDILGSLQRLETLRVEYAEAARVAHEKWVQANGGWEAAK
jgi:hypothetical protein